MAMVGIGGVTPLSRSWFIEYGGTGVQANEPVPAGRAKRARIPSLLVRTRGLSTYVGRSHYGIHLSCSPCPHACSGK